MTNIWTAGTFPSPLTLTFFFFSHYFVNMIAICSRLSLTVKSMSESFNTSQFHVVPPTGGKKKNKKRNWEKSIYKALRSASFLNVPIKAGVVLALKRFGYFRPLASAAGTGSFYALPRVRGVAVKPTVSAGSARRPRCVAGTDRVTSARHQTSKETSAPSFP